MHILARALALSGSMTLDAPGRSPGWFTAAQTAGVFTTVHMTRMRVSTASVSAAARIGHHTFCVILCCLLQKHWGLCLMQTPIPTCPDHPLGPPTCPHLIHAAEKSSTSIGVIVGYVLGGIAGGCESSAAGMHRAGSGSAQLLHAVMCLGVTATTWWRLLQCWPSASPTAARGGDGVGGLRRRGQLPRPRH